MESEGNVEEQKERVKQMGRKVGKEIEIRGIVEGGFSEQGIKAAEVKARRMETLRGEGRVCDGGLSRDMFSSLIRESGRMWPVSSLVVVSRQDATSRLASLPLCLG